jgi:hypothetical protein
LDRPLSAIETEARRADASIKDLKKVVDHVPETLVSSN